MRARQRGDATRAEGRGERRGAPHDFEGARWGRRRCIRRAPRRNQPRRSRHAARLRVLKRRAGATARFRSRGHSRETVACLERPTPRVPSPGFTSALPGSLMTIPSFGASNSRYRRYSVPLAASSDVRVGVGPSYRIPVPRIQVTRQLFMQQRHARPRAPDLRGDRTVPRDRQRQPISACSSPSPVTVRDPRGTQPVREINPVRAARRARRQAVRGTRRERGAFRERKIHTLIRRSAKTRTTIRGLRRFQIKLITRRLIRLRRIARGPRIGRRAYKFTETQAIHNHQAKQTPGAAGRSSPQDPSTHRFRQTLHAPARSLRSRLGR